MANAQFMSIQTETLGNPSTLSRYPKTSEQPNPTPTKIFLNTRFLRGIESAVWELQLWLEGSEHTILSFILNLEVFSFRGFVAGDWGVWGSGFGVIGFKIYGSGFRNLLTAEFGRGFNNVLISGL